MFWAGEAAMASEETMLTVPGASTILSAARETLSVLSVNRSFSSLGRAGAAVGAGASWAMARPTAARMLSATKRPRVMTSS